MTLRGAVIPLPGTGATVADLPEPCPRMSPASGATMSTMNRDCAGNLTNVKTRCPA